MAEVIPQITIDSSKVKETWVQNEVVTNDVYNAINKAVIDLKDNNNLLDSNAMLFREEYNSSSKNLNNAIHQGVYSFTNSAVNAPSGVNGGNLLVTNTSKTNQGSSIITQIAFCHNGAVYARTKNTSENFTAWNKLAYITDTISRAISDKNGLQIDTGYLKLSGGIMEGLVSLFTGSTVPTPEEQDSSKKITNTEWVQAWVKSFVANLSNNIEVETQEDGHFSCPALGITGLMAQNGYICLGKLFGNLVLQWGSSYEGSVLNLPISANLIVLVGMHEGLTKQIVTYSRVTNKFIGSDTDLYIYWIAVCKI